MIVEASVPVHPTEDVLKVRSAVSQIFPDGVLGGDDDRVIVVAGSLDAFVHKVKDQRIKDSALMVLRRSLDGDSLHFFLNKQAAFMGVVNFTSGDSGLGDVEVKVTGGAEELLLELS